MGDRLAESEGFFIALLKTEICGCNLLNSKTCKK